MTAVENDDWSDVCRKCRMRCVTVAADEAEPELVKLE
jgi:hypothetical protein